MQNNLSDIEGVIFSKPTREFEYKKGPKKGEKGLSLYIVLEIRGTGNGKDYIDFHKFEVVNPSVPLDDFQIKDPVVITYSLGGFEWNDDIINKTKAVYIKHADIQGNDTRDLRAQRPKREEVFTGAVPEAEDDDEGNDKLPF
jgi:hypothetical protein